MRSKAKPARRLVISLLAIAGAALILFFFHRYHYPHGLRSGKLTSFMGVLTHYAMDHGGRYPEGGATPLGSLQKLYPQYASRELAGMSGSESAAEKCLREGKTIETNISSWVYFPGFSTNDDPRIALIWEREAGIFVNGGRAEGHAVGFVGGGYDQVPPKDWPQFLKLQEALRAKVLKPEPPAQTPPQ